MPVTRSQARATANTNQQPVLRRSLRILQAAQKAVELAPVQPPPPPPPAAIPTRRPRHTRGVPQPPPPPPPPAPTARERAYARLRQLGLIPAADAIRRSRRIQGMPPLPPAPPPPAPPARARAPARPHQPAPVPLTAEEAGWRRNWETRRQDDWHSHHIRRNPNTPPILIRNDLRDPALQRWSNYIQTHAGADLTNLSTYRSQTYPIAPDAPPTVNQGHMWNMI
jgi:hypothetical protein